MKVSTAISAVLAEISGATNTTIGAPFTHLRHPRTRDPRRMCLGEQVILARFVFVDLTVLRHRQGASQRLKGSGREGTEPQHRYQRVTLAGISGCAAPRPKPK